MMSVRGSTKYQVLENSSLKCCLIGDTKSGKSSLAYRLQSQEFRTEYAATSFDNFAATTSVDGNPYHLSLFDTAGNHDMVRLRALSYVKTDVVLICFSITDPNSFVNAEKFWVQEMRCHLPRTPFLLVGTHKDSRFNQPDVVTHPLPYSDILIPSTRGSDMATRVGAFTYVECSSKTGDGFDELLRELILAVTVKPRESEKSSGCCCEIL